MANATSAQAKERVGIIGAGRMGLPMVKHMLRHGYSVTACDINAANLQQAREMGAKVAETPAALGRDVSFVILGVGYDEEVNEVVLGAQGVLQSLPSGSIIAVSSTVAIDTVTGARCQGARAGLGRPRRADLPRPLVRRRGQAARPCSAAGRRWSSAAVASTRPFAPISPISARSATARSARR